MYSVACCAMEKNDDIFDDLDTSFLPNVDLPSPRPRLLFLDWAIIVRCPTCKEYFFTVKRDQPDIPAIRCTDCKRHHHFLRHEIIAFMAQRKNLENNRMRYTFFDPNRREFTFLCNIWTNGTLRKGLYSRAYGNQSD